jgi:hypothetical protein
MLYCPCYIRGGDWWWKAVSPMKKETNKIGAEGCYMDDNDGRSNKAQLQNSVQEQVEQNRSHSKIKAVGTVLFNGEVGQNIDPKHFWCCGQNCFAETRKSTILLDPARQRHHT